MDWEAGGAVEEVGGTFEGALAGVLDLVFWVVEEPRMCLGGDPRVADVHLIFFVVQ